MFRYSFNGIISNVVIVGCGGTGSRAIPIIAQLLCSNEFTRNIKITLIDGDIVENKNTKRQLFLESEVGKNKAIVLSDRYRKGFKANIDAVPFFIPSCEELVNAEKGLSVNKETAEFLNSFADSYLEVTKKGGTPLAGGFVRDWPDLYGNHNRKKANTVVVSCVDSPDARRRILQLIHLVAYGHCGNSSYTIGDVFNNFTIIDAGNEDAFGQVSYFHPIIPTLCREMDVLKHMPDRSPCSTDISYVPMPIGKYKNMKEGVREGSCADLDQTLAINQMMATFIGMIFQNLLYGMKMDFHTIRANLNGTFSSDKMSLGWMKGVLTDNEDYLFGAIKDLEISDDHRSIYYGKMSNDYLTKASMTPITEGYAHSLSNSIISCGVDKAKLTSLKIGTDLLDSYYKTHHCLSNWKDIVWPTIFENVAAGFITPDDDLKKEVIRNATIKSPVVNQAAILLPALDPGRLTFAVEGNLLYSASADVIKGEGLDDILPTLSRLGHRGYCLPKSKDKLVVGRPTIYVRKDFYGYGDTSRIVSFEILPHKVCIRALAERIIETENMEKVLSWVQELLECNTILNTPMSCEERSGWMVSSCSIAGVRESRILRSTSTNITTKNLKFAVGSEKDYNDACAPAIFHKNGRLALSKEVALEVDDAHAKITEILHASAPKEATKGKAKKA